MLLFLIFCQFWQTENNLVIGDLHHQSVSFDYCVILDPSFESSANFNNLEIDNNLLIGDLQRPYFIFDYSFILRSIFTIFHGFWQSKDNLVSGDPHHH